MLKKVFTALIAAIALHGTTITHAAEWDIGANSRQRNEALQVSQVTEGVVLQARNVQVAPTTTSNTVSTGIGGLLGGALGAQAGKGNGKYVAGALGAVLGGVAGNVVGEKINQATAQELIIKKSDGSIVSITQAESDLYAGQPVYITGSYGKVRVIARHVGLASAM